jgi:hypothetical protein
VVCSGCQGRKDLGFCMPKFIAQIHCSHRDLGGLTGVCGEHLRDLRATAS